jgi:hypothetical protein
MEANKMKIITICFLIIFGFFNAAWAGPFLVCDPPAIDQDVEYYQIYQHGTLIADQIDPESDGSVRYDMEGMTPGSYKFTAKACNIWGCSADSNPYISPGVAIPPSGLRGEL